MSSLRANAVVTVRPGEDAEQAVKRLNGIMAKNGTRAALRRKEFYEKPSVQSRKKSAKARRVKRKHYTNDGQSLALIERERARYGE